MVGCEDDDGVFQHAAPVERLDQLADLRIDHRDIREIVLALAAQLLRCRIGQVHDGVMVDGNVLFAELFQRGWLTIDRCLVANGFRQIDLKGKKVGVPQGTSGDMILRMALTKAGMSISDIQVVPMDPSTIVAAFSSKQIEVAGIWYPLIDAIKPRVPDMKELTANKDFYPATSFINAFVARNEIVQENPKLVTSFIRVMKKAMDYRAANLDHSIELTTAFLKAPADTTAKVARSRKLLTSADLDKFTEDGTINKWLTDFNKMFQEFGTVKDPLPPE